MQDGNQNAHGNGFTISWEVQYRSQEGHPCRAILSGEFGEEFLMKTQAVLDWLSKSQAKGSAPAPVAEPNPKVLAAPGGTDDQKICPVHNVPMRRYEKNGQAWYSHRTVDGGWCQGKQSSVRGGTALATAERG